jgi:hypothetical protein
MAKKAGAALCAVLTIIGSALLWNELSNAASDTDASFDGVHNAGNYLVFSYWIAAIFMLLAIFKDHWATPGHLFFGSAGIVVIAGIINSNSSAVISFANIDAARVVFEAGGAGAPLAGLVFTFFGLFGLVNVYMSARSTAIAKLFEEGVYEGLERRHAIVAVAGFVVGAIGVVTLFLTDAIATGSAGSAALMGIATVGIIQVALIFQSVLTLDGDFAKLQLIFFGIYGWYGVVNVFQIQGANFDLGADEPRAVFGASCVFFSSFAAMYTSLKTLAGDASAAATEPLFSKRMVYLGFVLVLIGAALQWDAVDRAAAAAGERFSFDHSAANLYILLPIFVWYAYYVQHREEYTFSQPLYFAGTGTVIALFAGLINSGVYNVDYSLAGVNAARIALGNAVEPGIEIREPFAAQILTYLGFGFSGYGTISATQNVKPDSGNYKIWCAHVFFFALWISSFVVPLVGEAADPDNAANAAPADAAAAGLFGADTSSIYGTIFFQAAVNLAVQSSVMQTVTGTDGRHSVVATFALVLSSFVLLDAFLVAGDHSEDCGFNATFPGAFEDPNLECDLLISGFVLQWFAALVGTLIVLDVNGAMSFPVPNITPFLAVFGFGSGSDELELDEIAAAQADDAAETTSRVSDV